MTAMPTDDLPRLVRGKATAPYHRPGGAAHTAPNAWSSQLHAATASRSKTTASKRLY